MHKEVKLAKEEVELVRVDINTCCLYRQEEPTVHIRAQLRLKALRMPKCKGKVSMMEWELEI